MRSDVLQMLFEADGYISGEDISDRLHISRAAVWKNIKTLKEDGGIVDAKPNAGYRLVQLPDLLKPEYVGLFMPEASNRIIWMDAVDSTNNYAKKIAREGAADGTVAVAEHQTGGKGRLGRVWMSQPHTSVMMSFVIRPGVPPANAPVYNFATALGVAKAVEETCGLSPAIKWPNDVVYQGRKLCGILTEMSADMDSVEYLVVGVGTNVNQERFDGEIGQRAVSLRMIRGEKLDRAAVCASLIKNIDLYFDKLAKNGTDGIMDAYREKSAVLGREIRVIGHDGSASGRCVGFGPGGQLLVDTSEGLREFHAGDVSVRGVDDYV